MLLGHIGAGFACKSFEKKSPLWLFLVAAMLPDLIAYTLMIFGLETKTMFWSHSLIMVLAYCFISMIIILVVYRKLSTTLIFTVVIFSHWLFDLISWPLKVIGLENGINIFNKTSTYGLGLYKTIIPSIICELTLLIIGVTMYLLKKKKTLRNNKL